MGRGQAAGTVRMDIKMTNPIEAEIEKILNELVEREHKYHTTDYDGTVGVTKDDINSILELIKKEKIAELDKLFDKAIKFDYITADTSGWQKAVPLGYIAERLQELNLELEG